MDDPPDEYLEEQEELVGAGEQEELVDAGAEDAANGSAHAEQEEAVGDGEEEEIVDAGGETLDDYKYAPVEEAPPEEAKEEDASKPGDDEPVVQEHLRDSVEGSLRLKRLLSRDDNERAGKRLKDDDDGQRPIVQAKVNQLLTRWNLKTDVVMKHVLDNMSLEELNHVMATNYSPSKFDPRKTPAELVAAHILHMQEGKLGHGSRVDVVTAFKIRWKMTIEDEKTLRGLNHKDLRYVMDRFDGSIPLDDLITEASCEVPEGEEAGTKAAAPYRPGAATMGRFSRLELIDPLADAAVFGDANLSFSVQLAKHRKEMGHVGRVIATTFEEVDILRTRYQEIEESIKALEDHHAEVYHGIDCTRIAIDPRFQGMEEKLGAVYYNFPHSGAIQGFFDSHPVVNWRHENLMRLFFRALRSFVKPGGSVKVASNAGAVGVRYSYIVGSAIENEFQHVETMPFLEWHLHHYGRSYGDRRDMWKRPDAKNNQSYQSQNAMSDMVYCFQYAPSGKVLPKQSIRLPPTLSTLAECKDGPFKSLSGPAKVNLARQLHARFMKEVSGEH
eukprot:CAMPEP_0172810922 /NCGR_PEP_ID=MMETSP1075-20121228/9100_1 /TAXON_ID=2916 /ORGANISM="Ceratium fusus, Strain PA161109" /LENGTH=556 /DNA_ID=CAMNT_0013650297 /DNA_START=69 /DNA_END=1736 /DNA_ORIENTATION=+